MRVCVCKWLLRKYPKINSDENDNKIKIKTLYFTRAMEGHESVRLQIKYLKKNTDF